jgi:hypothetical protein
MHPRTARAFLIALLSLGLPFAGCDREPGSDLQTEVARLSAEVETTRQKLAAAEKEAAMRQDALVLAATETEAARKQTAEKEKLVAEKDAQIKAVQGELAKLKKHDGIVFAEIRASQHEGLTALALGRLQKFVNDYPNSPLYADATRAIVEMTTTSDRDTRAKVVAIDPRRPEREVLKRFTEGFATAEEMAPLLKGKTKADVVKILGSPNRTYREGAELGYVDKLLGPGGGREALVISFEAGRVSSVRAGYLGRPIRP